ncbi:hypothetical protein AMATHDRAFT_154314 [Amanita thiersii Skay4041]|uniref:Carboxylic ester hydrolase n=1 Tax=Amanita thiersii Skay4041 TaxID=703135 RepID=A0A2A9NFW5_9AGAR|nr:hypothetical protein AMATHDRAFT_154314 [Amanita thiersii Skay4041]
MHGLVNIFVSLVFCFLVTAQTNRPVVDLGYAKYAGVVDNTTHNTHFLGIRYAAPPIGALRWRAPEPPAPIAGVQSADTQPFTCFFAGFGVSAASPFRNGSFPTSLHDSNNSDNRRASTEFGPSEDCLFLNVYTPGILNPAHVTKPLPVVVWIHGGGYMSGSASGFRGTDFFNGDDLIREAGGNIVVVVIQYRLGVFGFLPGTNVKERGDLNAGLLDQHFALKWVQDHVGKFGGDPSLVTIWGESAGAGSVLQHVIAQDGNTTPPLFRGAITSSSFLPSQYNFDDTFSEDLYNEVVSLTGCSSSSGDQDTLTCLRAVDAGTLENANVKIGDSAFFGVFIFVPVVDGTFITQRPTQAFKQKKINGVFLLAITNTNEGNIFVDQTTADSVQTANYVAQLFPHFGEAEIDKAVEQYAGVGTNIEKANTIMGEAIFICPTYFLMRAFGDKAFKGQFAIPPALHGQDVAYYFPSTMNPNGRPAFDNVDFDNAFAQSFLNFAISLDPNVKTDPSNITPQWSAWEGGLNEILFNRTEDGRPDVRQVQTSDELLKRCTFWESVSALSGQ